MADNTPTPLKKNRLPVKPWVPAFEFCRKCKSRWDHMWGRCQRCGGDKATKA